ncbi:hypothetical protein [Winogradskyella marincola]|uniref:DUF3899 domain-containing protein n=1 Tax=Winogradskyella marincola TaxID=3037795 RepID=A0ABT6G030_9FLAO|nr:hypothetical protein [Winogradskyella sp. YYF002]MDG4715399.1 hypothetical protein [Winogradskyella sp. YYF002]
MVKTAGKMDENHIKKTKYEEWNEHLRTTKENSSYSQKRTDLLTITISGGGLYVLLETLREFKTGKIPIEDTSILVFAGSFLLAAIIINFISQITAYYANSYEEQYIQTQLSILKLSKSKKSKERKRGYRKEQELLDSKKNIFDKTTSFLNFLSIGFMILGIVLLVIFYYTIF